MRPPRETAVVQDPRFLEHRGPSGHPERPERLGAVAEAIAAYGDRVTPLAPRMATPDEILRVHGRGHLEGIERAVSQAPAQLDADTFVSSASYDVACLAAGASVDLVRKVARGDVATGIAAIRPPGHHAEADRPMGFCLLNNVAIAARAIQAEEGVERVFILDWDVHHGNGTQHYFEADPSVLYASTHQFPFYPGTGDFGECGVGPGEGATLNVPLPAGCGDAEYVAVMQRIVVPAVQSYRPDVMLISCGFDAHSDDPLGAMEISADGYRAMTAIVRALADDVCGGRIAFILEGGYSALGLREGIGAVLEQMVGPDPTFVPETVSVGRETHLQRVLDRVVTVHAKTFPGIGSV